MMQKKVQFLLRGLLCSSVSALLLSTSIFAQKTAPKLSVDYTSNVDPFIGVDWGGNTFVGSSIPFGLVKVGPRHAGF